jgi:hypothetical protein
MDRAFRMLIAACIVALIFALSALPAPALPA